MANYTAFFPKLALAAGLLLAALAAVPLFGRFRLPSPAAFLSIGVLAGLLGVSPTRDLPATTLEQVGALALFVILFQGGLGTGFKAARAAAPPILALGILGTAATAIRTTRGRHLSRKRPSSSALTAVAAARPSFDTFYARRLASVSCSYLATR